jgi:hypothetical protein
MKRWVQIAVGLSLAAATACTAVHPEPPSILLLPVPNSPPPATFPNVHREPVWLDKGRAHGSFIREKKLYVILESGGKQFSVLVAGVLIAPEQEKVALKCVADAIPYTLEVRAADPVTNDAGELQVSIGYHTGSAYRDLAATVKDSILDVRR